MRVSRNRLMAACHGKVALAVRRGDLLPVSEFRCADCGDPATQYDHRDYERPLDVEPVCQPCNNRRPTAQPTTDCGPIEVPWLSPSNVVWRHSYIDPDTRILHKFNVTGRLAVSMCGLQESRVQSNARYALGKCKKCYPKKKKVVKKVINIKFKAEKEYDAALKNLAVLQGVSGADVLKGYIRKEAKRRKCWPTDPEKMIWDENRKEWVE